MANATAVSFRKGTKDEHSTWKGGVNGEITVDTTDYTLWVHDGNSANIGNPLAKADTTNINTVNLTDPTIHSGTDGNKPLSYADLTNVQLTDISTVKTNLLGLGYANKNMDNVNTSSLAEGRSGISGDLNLAYANMSNASTQGLAERTAEQEADKGKNLAYKDMSNVNTDEFTLASGNAQGARVAKADLTNIDDTVLTNKINALDVYANKELSNLGNISGSLSTLHTKGIQLTTNLNTSINGLEDSDTKYPSSKLVKDTIDSLDKFPTMSTTGKSNYQILAGLYPYEYSLTITDAGTGYAEHNMLDVVYESYTAASTMPTPSVAYANELYQYTGTTTATYTQGSFYRCTADTQSNYSWVETSPMSIKIRVIEVDPDNNNEIVRFEILEPKYGTLELTEANCIACNIHTGTNATFSLSSTATGATKIQWKEPPAVPMVTDIEVTEKDEVTNQTVGRVTVTLSEIPTHIEIKTLIKGETIPGDITISPDGWTPLDKEMVFTPLDAADVLTNAWVIKVE